MVGKTDVKGDDPWDPKLLADLSEDEIEARHSQRGMDHIGLVASEIAAEAIMSRWMMDHPWL